jgi:integrase
MARQRRGGPVSALRAAVADYLTLRRSLGFKLERAGKLLDQFVTYCEDVGAETVTIELALSWANLPERGDRAWTAQRLSVVRQFAKHLALFDERAEIPPVGLAPDRSHRATPYLYSEEEVLALKAAAEAFPSPLRRVTLATIVGLLYATGMRVGEALRLDRDDVDFDNGVVMVRNSKFGKSRELPLHESTTEALRSYARRRDELCAPRSQAFFVSPVGTRLLYCNFHLAFLAMVRDAGLEPRSPGCRPRPHDLRHSFAVATLVNWYREGVDVEPRLAQLSTYLGHTHPGNTYWYLSAAPELLALAAQRLETAKRQHR